MVAVAGSILTAFPAACCSSRVGPATVRVFRYVPLVALALAKTYHRGIRLTRQLRRARRPRRNLAPSATAEPGSGRRPPRLTGTTRLAMAAGMCFTIGSAQVG
jgi:hypothetical protein